MLVHRRFEVKNHVPVPKNKKELKRLLRTGNAVPFHKMYYDAGHKIPQLLEWLRVPESYKFPSLFQKLQYVGAEWEPQFVGDISEIPFHDERFPYRYRNNAVLSLQLCFENYTFSVVNDLFTVHKGIKLKDSLQVKYIKDLVRESIDTQKLNEDHKNELINKYPNTITKCLEE